MSATTSDLQELRRALTVEMQPGRLHEIRIPKAGRAGTISGYFNRADLAADAVMRLNGVAAGVYITPNPVKDALLARAANRLKERAETTTSDHDVERLTRLLVDFDAVRPAGVSSSDEEHEAALARARVCRDWLVARGWPPLVLGDSGNGGHLMGAMDLPNDNASVAIIKRVLEALAFRFNDDTAVVDTTCHNPARIWKVYGTWARKGDDTPERPHRLARLLDVPDLQVIPKALLDELAALAPSTAPPRPGHSFTATAGEFDVEAWIARHGLVVERVGTHLQAKMWVLVSCPFNSDHGTDSAIFQQADGRLGFKCFHQGCAGNDWHALRDLVEPGWRERRGTTQRPYARGADTEENAEAPDIGDQVWPAALAEEAYHGVAGAYVRAIAPHTEADPVAILGQFLVWFGNVIGRSAFIAVEADRHYANEFLAVVADSSKGRKGTSASHVRRAYVEVDEPWATGRVLEGLSSGEGVIWAVRDAIIARQPIKDRGRVVDYQDVEVDPGVSDKRALVYEPELASALRAIGRDGNTLSAIIRRAWDAGNGFANRFVFLCARRARVLPEGGNVESVNLLPLIDRLKVAVAFAREVGELRRDEEARAAWRAAYPTLSDGKPGLFGAVTARAEAHVLRLSCLYALLDGSTVIHKPHLLAALALWQYAEDSARFIFGDSQGDPVADDVLAALKRVPEGLTRTELSDLFAATARRRRYDAASACSYAMASCCTFAKRQAGDRPNAGVTQRACEDDDDREFFRMFRIFRTHSASTMNYLDLARAASAPVVRPDDGDIPPRPDSEDVGMSAVPYGEGQHEKYERYEESRAGDAHAAATGLPIAPDLSPEEDRRTWAPDECPGDVPSACHPMLIRWAPMYGWLRIKDPFTGEWHEIATSDAPTAWKIEAQREKEARR